MLADLGTRSSAVVHSKDGLDELSVFAPSRIAWVRDGQVSVDTVEPSTFGLDAADRTEVEGRSVEESASLLRAVLDGKSGTACNLVVLNAAAALVVAGKAASLEDGIARAASSLDEGRAREKLEQLIQATNRS